jgi:DNA-binding CsgD family transcriptional regulator/tetratricopeptide (TPR) repeat protein
MAELVSLGRPNSPVLVGRARVLEQLLDICGRTPALVLVEGEAGVGKTRLVQELLARCERDGRRSFVGRCFELSEPFPLGPLLDALRGVELPNSLPAVTGALRPFLTELADRLPEPLPALGDTGAERHRLFRGLLELLSAFGPGLLVVEDLHWADQATLDFLRFLVLQAPPELALVCTYRREDLASLLRLDAQLPAGSTTTRIVLEPLNPEAVRELVRAILDITGTTEVSEAFGEYLFQQTAGLPLAVEEVLLLLRQRQELVCQRGTWVRRQLDALSVPQRLRDAINERLGRLEPAARALVRAVAVLGFPADERLLARLTGLTELACGDALVESLASALLFEVGDGHYGFRHALARQAVEEAMPAPLRRRLHLRAARALESAGDKPLARLAHHYRAAGETSMWVRYAEAAANRAVSYNDHAAAYALLRDAVSLPALAPLTRGWLAIRLARHAARCRGYEDAIAVLRPLLGEDAIPKRLRGRLRFWLGRLLYDTGESRAAYDEAVRALGELSGPPAAQVMSWLAVTPFAGAPVPQRLRWLDQALEIASRSSDRAMKLEIAATRAVLLVRAGDPACWQAIEEFPRPGPALTEIEQAMRGHGNVADALLHLGHYPPAAELNQRALHLAREHSPSFAKHFELTGLQLDWLNGRWNGLAQRLRDELDAVEDWPAATQICEAFLGLLLLAEGHTQPALRALHPLTGQLDGDSRLLTWVVAGIARARLAERKPAAAVAAINPVLRSVEENRMWLWAGELAPVSVEALLADGRRAEAVEVIARLAGAQEGRDAPAAFAALITCRALLAEADKLPEPAATTFLAAESAWLALPRPYEAARARARAGACRLPVDPDRGQALMLGALATFQELGAGWDAEYVRQALRRHGLVPPHRRGRRSYGNRLSPREEQVADLAAQGLQNLEIARTLHLSVKTVEGHLSSATRKLGKNPRGQAN